MLFHGTAVASVPVILAEGLRPMHSRTGIRIVPASASDWGGAFVASLVVPGGEEADAATLTTDALSDTARTATSAVKTAAEDTRADTTQVFRTVGSAEARDIAESDVYRNPEGLEGKYFYPTQAQAENLGAQYAKIGLGEQTLTSGRISTDLLNQFGSRSRLQARARRSSCGAIFFPTSLASRSKGRCRDRGKPRWRRRGWRYCRPSGAGFAARCPQVRARC